MSRLNRVINNSNQLQNKVQNKAAPDNKVPMYNGQGKAVKIGNAERKKRIAITLFIVSGVMLFIYLPQAFIRDKNRFSNKYPKDLDISMIKTISDYYSKNQSEDFDSDGLDNAAEDKYNCNPWSNDTDNDGADDYYEIYVSKTDPNKADKDILIDFQKDYDKNTGVDVDTPFKMNDVILWAEDYSSKSLGAVVATQKGYHFSNFSGYAQFPHGGKIYAYTTDRGNYQMLPYLEEADAWKIEGIHNVEIYSSPIKEVVEFDLFFHPLYARYNWFSGFWAFILPDRGFIAASRKAEADVLPDTSEITMATNHSFVRNDESGVRFSKDTKSLTDLQFVRNMIDSDRCVLVSLYSPANGEYRGIIYGYDSNNNLYIADADTEDIVGIIYVDVKAKRILTGDGLSGINTYFDWYGLGFNSKYYDRISFYSVAQSGMEVDTATSTDPYIYIDESIPIEETTAAITTEVTTEATTEPPTEVPTEADTEVPTEATEQPDTEADIMTE